MIDINIDELKSFKNDYYREISVIEENIDTIFNELINLKQAINTPNISKKIEEFNENYYSTKNVIHDNSLALDNKIEETIIKYEELLMDIKKGVNND